jgi:outer membrane protein
MKNLSLVLNIVLLIAVIILYVLYFSGNKPAGKSNTNDSTAIGELKIAFINADTVLKYYDYLKINKDKLEAKTKKLDQDYRNRAMGLQSEISNYQRSVNSMTYGQVKAAEEDLAKKQQNLQMYQQTLTQQLMQDEAELNRALYERVTAYLKKYGSDKGLHLVLKYDPSSDMLYGTQAIDITQDVIQGLNEDFKTEGSVPADTTAAKKK